MAGLAHLLPLVTGLKKLRRSLFPLKFLDLSFTYLLMKCSSIVLYRPKIMFMDVIWTARAVKQIQFEVLNSILIWQDSRAAGTAAIKMQMRSLLLHLGFIKSFFKCSDVQMFRCSDVQMFRCSNVQLRWSVVHMFLLRVAGELWGDPTAQVWLRGLRSM